MTQLKPQENTTLIQYTVNSSIRWTSLSHSSDWLIYPLVSKVFFDCFFYTVHIAMNMARNVLAGDLQQHAY